MLSFPDKKHLIFDLDLTLVELLWPDDVHERTRAFLKTIDRSLAEKTEAWGYEGFNIMIKKYGSEVKKGLDAIYLDCESERLKEAMKINNQVVDFIKLNKDNYNFYIWSNNQRQTIERILSQYNLEKYFETIAAGSDVQLFKPDIEGFYRIYEKGNNKKDYLMIGDSHNDKIAADNAGIDYFYLHI